MLTRAMADVVRLLADRRGWWMSGLLATLATALRLPGLSRPHEFVFDETYYAKDAFSLLRFGYERAFVDNANALLLAGNTGVFKDGAAYVVHPPLGKWVIAIGEAAFGMNPFGWRIAMCVLGIIAVVLVHRTALRLTANPWTAGLAGLFMAIDGLAIVMSRTALLDQTLTFCIIATFHALVLDRDYYRHTLALRQYAKSPRWRTLRPWRLVAMVGITCAVATKWSAAPIGLAFALLALGWDVQARRQAGLGNRYWPGDVLWVIVSTKFVIIGYLLSWIGWFRSSDAWNRNATSDLSWLPQPLQALVAYHQSALHFHTTLTSSHPYKASPFGWPLMLRPTSFSYNTYATGTAGCRADSCSAEVLALGNVILWWLGSATIIIMLVGLLLRRFGVQWRFRGRAIRPGSRLDVDVIVGPLVGFAAGWLPWLWFHERTTFTFYAIVMAPFLFMLLAYGLTLFATVPVPVVSETPPEPEPTDVLPGLLAERVDSTVLDIEPMLAPATEATTPVMADVRHERRFGIAVFAITIAIAFSVYYYPIWTGMQLSYTGWQHRMWLDNWV